jgi:hypothetical protein
MNKTIVTILATLSLTTGCVNCVNQSIHGSGKAVVIKTDTKAVVAPKTAPKKVSNTSTNSEWTLVSKTTEVISSTPVLF